LIFLKGVAHLMLSPDALSRTFGQAQYGDHFYLYLVPSLAIGLYLTWAGFTTPMRDR
jgi:hypothetical protein